MFLVFWLFGDHLLLSATLFTKTIICSLQDVQSPAWLAAGCTWGSEEISTTGVDLSPLPALLPPPGQDLHEVPDVGGDVAVEDGHVASLHEHVVDDHPVVRHYHWKQNIAGQDRSRGKTHWIMCQIEWKRDMFPFELIYSDRSIRSGLVSPFQRYITLYIYCKYYGLKGIFNICK